MVVVTVVTVMVFLYQAIIVVFHWVVIVSMRRVVVTGGHVDVPGGHLDQVLMEVAAAVEKAESQYGITHWITPTYMILQQQIMGYHPSHR
jgi:hypothetical protein